MKVRKKYVFFLYFGQHETFIYSILHSFHKILNFKFNNNPGYLIVSK